jgi:hypothetical protein
LLSIKYPIGGTHRTGCGNQASSHHRKNLRLAMMEFEPFDWNLVGPDYHSQWPQSLLSALAMLDEPESLFSSAGLTLTDRRNRADIDLIEGLEQLKSWYNG